MADPNNARILYFRMSLDHHFHFLGINVETSHDYQVSGPVQDGQPPFTVKGCDITGIEPSIHDPFICDLGTPEITFCYRGPFDPEHPFLLFIDDITFQVPYMGFVTRQKSTHCSCFFLLRAPVRCNDRGTFRKSVAFKELGPEKLFCPCVYPEVQLISPRHHEAKSRWDRMSLCYYGKEEGVHGRNCCNDSYFRLYHCLKA